MKISLNFLKEFFEVDVPKDKLVSILTMAGIGVGALEEVDGDITAEIEVTSNRYDWLSVVGLARELAASLDKKLDIDYPKVTKIPVYKGKNIIIADPKDCPLYVARFFSCAKVAPSPAWLKERVLHCGINSINNVVDITNYNMLKWGNPLHAFDAKKIEGDIYIRRARQDEQFVGLDDKERQLTSENLVIADDKKIIALAGVMGARNSEVDNATTEVILEAAIFSPLVVRRSRRAAGVDTDSSYRFERQVFAQYLEYASAQSAQMIEELAHAKPVGYKEAGKAPKTPPVSIALEVKSVNEYLGTQIDIKKIKKILLSLGCACTGAAAGKLKVTAPAFRFDIREPVDLYEEVARVYGYERIPLAYPCLSQQTAPRDEISEFKTALRGHASILGLKEIITYSAQAEEDLAKLGEKDFIKFVNPLRSQENTLRTTLLLGMTKTIAYNLNRSRAGLRFFEIANVYNRCAGGFSEKPYMAIGVSAKEHDFFYLKGIAQKLMRFICVPDCAFREEGVPYFTNALKISCGDTSIGFLGKLDTKVKDDFDLKDDIFFAQFDVNALYSAQQEKKYRAFSSFPEVFRDISIALRHDKQFKIIEGLLKGKSEYLCDYRIIDTYAGKDLPKDHGAFTLRVYYQSQSRTLTSEEIDTIHTNIRHALSSTDGVILR